VSDDTEESGAVYMTTGAAIAEAIGNVAWACFWGFMAWLCFGHPGVQ